MSSSSDSNFFLYIYMVNRHILSGNDWRVLQKYYVLLRQK